GPAALVRAGDGVQRERRERAVAGAGGLPLRGAAGAGRRGGDGAARAARGGGLPLVGPAGLAAGGCDGVRAAAARAARYAGDRAGRQRRAALADAGTGDGAAVGGREARADRVDGKARGEEAGAAAEPEPWAHAVPRDLGAGRAARVRRRSEEHTSE